MTTLLGIMAATVVLVFYALHRRTLPLMLAAVAATAAAAACSFAEGAWPIGAIEAVWALLVARKAWALRLRARRTTA